MHTIQSDVPRCSLRVLLVEDSPLLAGRLAEVIRRLHDVELVGIVDNQANAIAALERDKPDVLILDLHLRQGTGFGVLRGMRADAPRPTTLILTTYDLPEYRREAQALGAKVFLDKSRDYNRLPQLLLDLLAEKMHDRDP